MYETHVHKKRVHFLSCGIWDPTLHCLNRNHVLCLSPLNFVFKIPSEETEGAAGILISVTWNWLHVCFGGMTIKKILSWPFHGCWCCWLGCDGGSRYLHCAHSGFSLQCYWLISQFTKEKIYILRTISKVSETGMC